MLSQRIQSEKDYIRYDSTGIWKEQNHRDGKKISGCQEFRKREGRMSRWNRGFLGQ